MDHSLPLSFISHYVCYSQGDSFSCFKSIALKRQPKPEIFSVHGRIIRFGPHSFVVKML